MLLHTKCCGLIEDFGKISPLQYSNFNSNDGEFVAFLLIDCSLIMPMVSLKSDAFVIAIFQGLLDAYRLRLRFSLDPPTPRYAYKIS